MDALFPPTAPYRSAARGMDVQGYRLSSDELRAGLEVRAISLTALPLELVAELLRMRQCWGGEGFGETRGGALA